MQKPSNLIRLPLIGAALLAALFAASGCGTTTADVDRGRELFRVKCGTCHTLAQAGTSGTLGPDLDSAFAAARAVGQTESTIAGVVKPQVENPRPSNDNAMISMPPEIVSGQDLEDVAAYVARYAGVPGAAPPQVPGGPGAQVFANNGCGTCHTLSGAEGAGGTTGPDLDEVLPGQSAAMIHESIVDPEAEITKGFPAGVMPKTFESQISASELDQLVQYLIGSTSKGSKKQG
jgi:mono/diheme cytochrome c family protein